MRLGVEERNRNRAEENAPIAWRELLEADCLAVEVVVRVDAMGLLIPEESRFVTRYLRLHTLLNRLDGYVRV